MTPYKIAFRKEPKLPFQLLNEDQLDVTVANTAIVDRLASFRGSIHERHILKKEQREKISVGDTVYKRNNRNRNRKLRGWNWTGPFQELRRRWQKVKPPLTDQGNNTLPKRLRGLRNSRANKERWNQGVRAH